MFLEDILQLASDTTVVIDAQRIAMSHHQWSNTGRDGDYVWGQFQFTDKKPYQVAVHLALMQNGTGGMACGCGSRYPCAHTIALLLRLVKQPETFTQQQTPQPERDRWRLNETPVQPTPEEVQRGLNQLEQWLTNLIRHGLGDPQIRDYPFWDAITDRMLAARLPGLAQRLYEITHIAVHDSEWVEPLLEELGKLMLLIQSFRRFNSLPPETQADLREAVGWRSGESGTDSIEDRWLVLGRRQRVLRGNIPEQATWLYGVESCRMALLYGPFSWVVGQMVEAALAYLPSRAPLKVSATQIGEVMPAVPVKGARIDEAVVAFGKALAANPWLNQYPVLLDAVYVSRFGKGWTLRHADGTYLPIAAHFPHKWVLHGLGGGRPLQVAAIWNGNHLFPMSASNGEPFIDLNKLIGYKETRRRSL